MEQGGSAVFCSSCILSLRTRGLAPSPPGARVALLGGACCLGPTHRESCTEACPGGLSQAASLSAFLLLQFMFLTGGVVFLTLIVNGTTTQFLVALLKMNKTSDIKVSPGCCRGRATRGPALLREADVHPGTPSGWGKRGRPSSGGSGPGWLGTP